MSVLVLIHVTLFETILMLINVINGDKFAKLSA